MANIKVALQPLIAFLTANKDKRVSTVLKEAIELATARTGGGGGARSYHLVDNVVIAAKCGYFDMWFKQGGDGDMEFGTKTSSPSGLNSLSKEGAAAWAKQNTAHRKSRDALLMSIADGETEISEMPALLQGFEDARAQRLEPTVAGYALLEDLLNAK